MYNGTIFPNASAIQEKVAKSQWRTYKQEKRYSSDNGTL